MRGLSRVSCAQVLLAGALAACSASGDKGNPLGSGADGGTSGSGNGVGTGGAIQIGTGGGNSGGPSETCVRIGMLGRKPSYGADGGDDSDALYTWLNGHVKAGTSVDVVTKKPALTADFLGKYDVLILQALQDAESSPNWTFSAAELGAFEAWVRGGGGVIALMGYGANTQEVVPTNQLLAFTGMSYNEDDVLGACTDQVNGQDCCYCTFSSTPVRGWNPVHPIAQNVSAVGAFHGRSVLAADGDVVLSDGAQVYGATKQMDAGRAFLYFDEWVAYSSQWSGMKMPNASCFDMNNACFGHTPDPEYQVPQFWYNALKWAASDAGCFDFTPDVPIVR
jgi:hypothetical protein